MAEIASGTVRYSAPAIAFHWLTMVLVVAGVAIALSLDSTETAAERNELLAVHKSIGLVIFALAWLRVGWRVTHKVPSPPAGQPLWQRAAALVTHMTLYLITLAMPVSGYISAAARGRETTFFGLFKVPQWVPLDRSLSTLTEQIHEWSSWALYGLVALHAAAALYHQFVVQDGLLGRMWPARWAPTDPSDEKELPISGDY
jgi:cytochrome b561